MFVDVSKGSSKEAAQALSTECQADLTAQGMPDLNTLLFVELSRELGRPVGGSETEGGAYRAPASIMKGAIAAKKAAPSGTLRTYSLVIQAAKESGSTVELEEWIQMLATRLQAHSHPYASRMAMLMQARWQNERMWHVDRFPNAGKAVQPESNQQYAGTRVGPGLVCPACLHHPREKWSVQLNLFLEKLRGVVLELRHLPVRPIAHRRNLDSRFAANAP